MGQNTGPERFAARKKGREQETKGDSESNLPHRFGKGHPLAIGQIDNMPQSKENAGDDHAPTHPISADSPEQKTAKQDFLQKSGTGHTAYAENGIRDGKGRCRPIPKIPGGQNDQRYIPEKSAGRRLRFAQAISLRETVFSDPEKQKQARAEMKNRGGTVLCPDRVEELGA